MDMTLFPCTACQASGAVMVENNARNVSARWNEPNYMLVKTQRVCLGCGGKGYKEIPVSVAEKVVASRR